jgi:hypothetical protein
MCNAGIKLGHGDVCKHVGFITNLVDECAYKCVIFTGGIAVVGGVDVIVGYNTVILPVAPGEWQHDAPRIVILIVIGPLAHDETGYATPSITWRATRANNAARIFAPTKSP